MRRKFFTKHKSLLVYFVIMFFLIVSVFLRLMTSGGRVDHSADNCQGAVSQKTQCWQKQIESTLKRQGMEAAFDLFGRLYNGDHDFAADCHAFTHSLGRAAYLEYSAQKDMKLSSKTFYCGYGFYHGFMESLLQASGDLQQARDFCEYVDSKLRLQISGAGNACYHGIGHGAVDGGDPRAWGNTDAMIAPGLSLCEKVASSKLQLFLCTSGVFNAIEVLSADKKYKLDDFKHDPYALCAKQNPDYFEACYTNVLSVLFRFYGNDYSKTTRVVFATVPDVGFKTREDFSIAEIVTAALFNDAVRVYLANDKSTEENVMSTCRSLDKSMKRACIDGLSSGLMKFGVPGHEYARALAFCGSDLLFSDEREICYGEVLTRLGNWYSAGKSKEICLEVATIWQKFCGQ